MGAVTYPNKEVINFIENNLIPVRLTSDTEPQASQYNVKWTPKILILDANGKVHQETMGFVPPEEFLASLELGLAKVDFDLDCLEECSRHLDNVLGKYPRSQEAAEAVFLNGVTGYKKNGSVAELKNAYQTLHDKYGTSLWATRAEPYRLL